MITTYQEGDGWIASTTNHNFTAQGKTEFEALESLYRVVKGHLILLGRECVQRRDVILDAAIAPQ